MTPLLFLPFFSYSLVYLLFCFVCLFFLCLFVNFCSSFRCVNFGPFFLKFFFRVGFVFFQPQMHEVLYCLFSSILAFLSFFVFVYFFLFFTFGYCFVCFSFVCWVSFFFSFSSSSFVCAIFISFLVFPLLFVFVFFLGFQFPLPPQPFFNFFNFLVGLRVAFVWGRIGFFLVCFVFRTTVPSKTMTPVDTDVCCLMMSLWRKLEIRRWTSISTVQCQRTRMESERHSLTHPFPSSQPHS